MCQVLRCVNVQFLNLWSGRGGFDCVPWSIDGSLRWCTLSKSWPNYMYMAAISTKTTPCLGQVQMDILPVLVSGFFYTLPVPNVFNCFDSPFNTNLLKKIPFVAAHVQCTNQWECLPREPVN